jgi:uncharacterized repeat protein (TIGR03803 family)
MKRIITIIILMFSTALSAQVYMYGTTSEGGANNLGTIYRVDENGQNFEKLFDFSTATGGTPRAGLTQADNGMLYGFTTTDGQLVNPGAVIALGSFYKYDPHNDLFTVIEYLDDQSEIGNTFNNSPTIGSGNLLYMASEASDLGSLDGILSSFDVVSESFNVLDTFTVIYGQPKSKLLMASDGNLYVTTNNGGDNGHGAVVKYDMGQGELDLLHSSAYDQLANPTVNDYKNVNNNPLFEASNGALYGASRGGGISSIGMVYTINKDGTGYQIIQIMSAGITDEGYKPEGGFVEKNGLLYSTTPQEDIENDNSGTIYTIDIATNTLDFIYTLDLEGGAPKGTFVESTNGRLYVACSGGPINSGSLIELNTVSTSVVARHTFNAADGLVPLNNGLALVDLSNLSIAETPNQSASVYPNPSTGTFTVNGLNIENVIIMALDGRNIPFTLEGNIVQISEAQSGVYFLKITDVNNNSFSKKIIIK